MGLSAFAFEIEDGNLVIRNNNTREILWSGKPKGYPAEAVYPVSGTSDAIVLLTYSSKRSGSFKNLLRISTDGTIVWEAELPDIGGDAYVKVAVRDRRLVGWSWSGYMVEINWDTGKIESRTFTK